MRLMIVIISVSMLAAAHTLSIPGYKTTYSVKQEGKGEAEVKKGTMVTVHATVRDRSACYDLLSSRIGSFSVPRVS